MKKNILFFTTLLATLFLLCGSAVYANKNGEKTDTSWFTWLDRSYAPELVLQPYFNLKSVLVLKVPVCNVLGLPFWEGFNMDSDNLACWTIIDANKDATAPMATNIWRVNVDDFLEGDQSMYIKGNSKNDDWLISPTIKMDATKAYKLKYHYMTDSWYENEFEVLASNKGVGVANFTKELVAKKTYYNDDWVEKMVYITNFGGDVNLGWHVTGTYLNYVYLDNVSIEELACMEPMDLDVKDIQIDKATIYWKDVVNSAWEYYVEEEDGGGPSGAGTAVAKSEVTVSKDSNNKNFLPNTVYDYYVRAKCVSGKFGEWIGPFSFRTACKVISAPFTEGFNVSSKTFTCWSIIDNNKDQYESGENGWLQNDNSTHEGDMAMSFYGGDSFTTHDDWLISPAIKMNGGIYAVSYYYKTNASYDNEFEVLLSNKGTRLTNFTEVLQTKATHKNNAFKKKILYVSGETGEINIAWHITAKGRVAVNIDLVTIEEVSCMGPDNEVVIDALQKDSAAITWTDTNNSKWEYFVQPEGAGPAPVGSGLLANSNKITVTKTSSGVGGVNLQPNTEYEFFVRASCGAGKNSLWIGPVKFKTLCEFGILPYWEGFNANSATASCWTVVDNNMDADTYSNIWRVNDYNYFEGDQGMYFYGYTEGAMNDDWLISPRFKFDVKKFYRLKYHFKTDAFNKNDFQVALSNKGAGLANFTQILATKKGHSSDVWEEETLIIASTAGDVNIGWHVTTDGGESTSLYVDNVFIEEVKDCPEPLNLGTKDLKQTTVTLLWDDAYGKNWEYVVQDQGGTAPVGNGTTSSKKENLVTKDQAGKNLNPNTAYEFYARTVCGDGTFSLWSGPYKFRTLCNIIPVPFKEGFNSNSTSVYCWTIIDENKDATSPAGENIWSITDYDPFEGSHGIYYYSYNNDDQESNDWLISPTFSLSKAKIYRLKYYFKTEMSSDNNEFEVLLSNSGINPTDFKNELIKNQSYKSINYQSKTAFITGFDGNVNLAWHTKGLGSIDIFIDDVVLEEVATCPEPIDLGVKDVTKNKATVTWTDDFKATNWEYVLQEAGKGVPAGSGTLVSKKENILTKESSGVNLVPNTDYEFYVRTVCGNGTYSIWSGPFNFSTLCDIYSTPFWEGFNSSSKTLRCWTIIDGNDDGDPIWGGNLWGPGVFTKYEGNQAMNIGVWDWLGEVISDDWLISPDLKMDNGSYILKYHYWTSDDGAKFGVSLSNAGVDVDQFTTPLVAEAVFNTGNWKEEVVFFNSTQGTSNIGWHLTSVGSAELSIDNVVVKKIETCPEPYYVTTSNQTSNSVDVEWQQLGGITSWEVLVVDFGGDETAIPVKSLTVNGAPKATIAGLSPGEPYTIYVRAKCTGGKTNSDWSTPVNTSTKVGLNDECNGAFNVPVNSGLACLKSTPASVLAATKSSNVTPFCSSGIVYDVWFEFTATAIVHLLTIKDLQSISGNISSLGIEGALYDQPCAAITNTPLACFVFIPEENSAVMNKLVPGKKYYLRLGVEDISQTDFIFNVCITTGNFTPLEVSPSGDKYTVEELVEDILVKSNCDLVSNVRYQNGDGGAKAMTYNTVGYFNKAGSDFPFKEGIVLGTNEVEYIPGPYKGYYVDRGGNEERWVGDKDINDAIDDAGGGPYPDKRVTQIEFDFIPIKEEIKFDYLFASNSYDESCGEVCNVGAMFAAWLVDSTTGEGQNLAKISGTKIPIAINTIRDVEKSKAPCTSVNPEWFWKYFRDIDSPLEASIDLVGLTKAMSSETVTVIPGRKYHIKLAVMDFCPNVQHTSAVFFNAGSFDLGNLDLGADMLVENGNAICGGESRILKSGLGTEGVVIKWYKDNIVIPGAISPDLEVFETGQYKVVGKYSAIDCEVVGSIKVEIYPDISTVVAAPKVLPICRKTLNTLTVDLTSVEADMLIKVDPINYKMFYYKTKQDAVAGVGAIADPTSYDVETKGTDVVLYIKVIDQRTGCSEIFEWTLRATKGIIPAAREQVKICATYTLPDLEANQYYYSESAAKGIAYKAGDILTEASEHTIYVLQDNGNGCYEEISYKVIITAAVKADIVADVELECSLHILAPLSAHNKYFTQAGGQGMELAVGSLLPHTQTVYIYASSNDGLCVEESSFKVSYKDCPIPKGISPNGDGLNDRFDLKEHGVSSMVIYNRYGAEVYSFQGAYTDQWYGQEKGDKLLPDGTYYYVVIAHGKTRTGWVQINK
ncbi:choice-of-anchor J domain-containing protein [Flavobacterium sp. HSC-61S13]|uniref:choice-of-anchor J domain-containing protein n=1 Tax=Flavobacterium sp. HSC-61S13 TaxID=2910963 RepID=UPI00209CF378|nr:choice-of-anchor J domain-containing protein [Flavobacterium sp. HSC-61S13]MCP1995107.1 gliding motility-associated-like protein [Flavobacterium sp. HSC-61S13]